MQHDNLAKRYKNISMPFKYKQKGIALITVMLIVALAAVLATQITSRLQMQIQRTSNVNMNQQAYWYAVGAEAFAKRVLIKIFEDEPDVTNLEQAWAVEEQTFPIDGGSISAKVNDLQACLNLNALKAPTDPGKKSAARKALEKLIVGLKIEGIAEFDAEAMGDSLTDWVDADSNRTGAGGAEDDDYASNEFPYLTANNFLVSINELRIIANFTPAIINALKPYVCIIPNSDLHKININTITAKNGVLLEALLGVPRDAADNILSARPEEGFANIGEFMALEEVTGLQLAADHIKLEDLFVVDSEFFSLSARTNFVDSYFSMISVMKIEDKKITVISRTIGRP